ncbi:MAG: FAD-dependent oxidoreductase [Opitutaceae bacterium]|nr:FAD-dependent oxidoreductase [Opitutaceae bacterium]
MSERHVDVLILGAGIAGLLLARELRGPGLRVAVAHDPSHPGASEAAVGLLNPVRGQRCTLAWRAAETFAAAHEAYGEIARATGSTVLRPVEVVRTFATADEQAAFERRIPAIVAAGFAVRDLAELPAGWRGAGHGGVAIGGGGALDARRLVDVLRSEARAAGDLVAQRCCPDEWDADHVVLAGGIDDLAPAAGRPLPLRPVRGESLLVRAPALEAHSAYVCGHHLAPMGDGLWSCGGTKVPGDMMRETTADGRAELEAFLARHLATPWEVVAQACGVRAATMDTRPLVGAVDDSGRLHAFNGFGSQGYVIVPWLARRLADHLTSGAPLPTETEPRRFTPPRARGDASGHWDAVAVARALTLAALAPGDFAVDLTAGNGADTHALAQAVGADGAVLSIDIQPAALEATRRRLAREGCETPVDLRCANHAGLGELIAPAWRGRVGAVVANLGHLPGSNSSVATRPESTTAAFAAALSVLRRGGVLVAVVYPQRDGGTAELAAIERWAASLDGNLWQVIWHRPPDRPQRASVVFSARRS